MTTDDTLALDITARGCRATANYHRSDDGVATIRLYVHERLVRQFEYPAYRIWNIAAHFEMEGVPVLLEEFGAGGAA